MNAASVVGTLKPYQLLKKSSILGSESLEEEYYRAIATNIVQELIHRQKEHEKLEAEAQEEEDAKQTRADVASAGSQRMTSSDARRNYKEKVSTTNLKLQKLNVRLDPQSTFIFVTAVHLQSCAKQGVVR